MSDNLKYTGPIDRVRVNMNEDYEINHFIKQYLKDNGFEDSNENRKEMHQHLDNYAKQHKGTVTRDDLTKYLKSAIIVTNKKT